MCNKHSQIRALATWLPIVSRMYNFYGNSVLYSEIYTAIYLPLHLFSKTSPSSPSPPLPPATPADVGLLMQLGVDGVFVGSGIFKSSQPEKRARAMVQAVTHYNDPQILAKVSAGLGEAMVGL